MALGPLTLGTTIPQASRLSKSAMSAGAPFFHATWLSAPNEDAQMSVLLPGSEACTIVSIQDPTDNDTVSNGPVPMSGAIQVDRGKARPDLTENDTVDGLIGYQGLSVGGNSVENDTFYHRKRPR